MYPYLHQSSLSSLMYLISTTIITIITHVPLSPPLSSLSSLMYPYLNHSSLSPLMYPYLHHCHHSCTLSPPLSSLSSLMYPYLHHCHHLVPHNPLANVRFTAIKFDVSRKQCGTEAMATTCSPISHLFRPKLLPLSTPWLLHH